MYRVVKYFTDLQDNNFPYNVGDVFPRDGMAVTDERIRELASSNNLQHTPLIEAVEDVSIQTDEAQADEPVEQGFRRRSRRERLSILE